MDIVPLCLYINEGNGRNFINYPSKIRTENQTKLSCLEKYGYQSKTFFVINPDFRPIPVGATLFSFKNGTSSTVSLEIAYDPFNIVEKSYFFNGFIFDFLIFRLILEQRNFKIKSHYADYW